MNFLTGSEPIDTINIQKNILSATDQVSTSISNISEYQKYLELSFYINELTKYLNYEKLDSSLKIFIETILRFFIN
jgi:hypothetical protein